MAESKKLTELTEVNQISENSLVYAVDPNRPLYEQSVGISKENLLQGVTSGFQGVLYISDPTPTVDGTYKPQDEGTYPNGLTYEPSTTDANKIVWFILSGGVWTKDAQEINTPIENVVEESNTTKAVSGKAVYDETNKSEEVTDIIEGKYIRPIDGVIANTSTSNVTGFVPVNEGQIVVFSGTNANGGVSVGGYDENKNYIGSLLSGTNSAQIDIKIQIPNNIKFVVATSRNESVSPPQLLVFKVFKSVKQLISDIEEEYETKDGVNQKLSNYALTSDLSDESKNIVLGKGKNLLDKSLFESGSYHSSGVPISSSTSLRTPVIPIDASKGFISIKEKETMSSPNKVFFYNSPNATSGSFISSYSNNDTFNGIPIPTNASHFAVILTSNQQEIDISNPTDNQLSNRQQVEYGITATEFEPYGYYVNNKYLPYNLITNEELSVKLLGYKKDEPNIKIDFITDRHFNLYSLHPNGEYVIHEFKKMNNVDSLDNGWYSPYMYHNGDILGQGSFNFIHMVNNANEQVHVGVSHGCAEQIKAEFFLDGILFDPTTATSAIEGDIFTFNFVENNYIGDQALTESNANGRTYPKTPLELSTIHYLSGEIRGSSKIRYHNKLVIMRDNLSFSRCYLTMHSPVKTSFSRVQLNNIEDTVNDVDTLTAISPSTANFSEAFNYKTSNNLYADNATMVTCYDDNGRIFRTECFVTDEQKKKMTVTWGASTSKTYFHPVIIKPASDVKGIPIDVFNTGDIIDGIIEKEVIIG